MFLKGDRRRKMKNKMRKVTALMTGMTLVLVGLLSCDNWMVDSLLKKTEAGALSSVRIDGSGERGGGAGGVLILNAIVEPESAANSELIWESDRPDVAEVGRNSGVVALLKEGEAVITVRTGDGKYHDSRMVRVRNTVVAVTGLSLDSGDITGIARDVVILNAAVEPQDATDKGIKWTSSPPGVVKVINGMVILVGPGTATITATSMYDATVKESRTVTVDPVPVSGVTLNKRLIVGADSGTIHLSANVSPSNATNKKVSWESDNKTVATVERDTGVVTLQSTGDATITATAEGGIVAICEVKALVESSKDLKIKFKAVGTGVDQVNDTFEKIHNYLYGRSPADVGELIGLGDYIDLPFLQVAGYPVDDDTAVNGKIPAGQATGDQLRLIVVGRNSFNAQGSYEGSGSMETGGPDPAIAHIVMQFKDCPGNRRRNRINSNIDYGTSEMSEYLRGTFYDGLKKAGVPLDNGDIIWAPKRYVAFLGEIGASAVLITDKLWIPTAREMTGDASGSNPAESAVNQARLEYYDSPASRKKNTVLVNEQNIYYWTASPYVGYYGSVRSVNLSGDVSVYLNGNSLGGVAPAFCVK
jgi:uncharacterized protein YjdB